ncbi:hypothetical protein AGMMS49991_11990 [Spirochaetia bacterium]|nr:hypothetical protein AGMMS49991_11990 [Spirochaetia bacterium]
MAEMKYSLLDPLADPRETDIYSVSTKPAAIWQSKGETRAQMRDRIGGVQDVTGPVVDITDPKHPVVNHDDESLTPPT